jgi:hypothetical protein
MIEDNLELTMRLQKSAIRNKQSDLLLFSLLLKRFDSCIDGEKQRISLFDMQPDP